MGFDALSVSNNVLILSDHLKARIHWKVEHILNTYWITYDAFFLSKLVQFEFNFTNSVVSFKLFTKSK